MSRLSPAAAPPPPEFHGETEALWFWVAADGDDAVRASISRWVLHYRFKGNLDGSDAAATYSAHRSLIDAAVLRRIDAGSREPVILREADFPGRPQ